MVARGSPTTLQLRQFHAVSSLVVKPRLWVRVPCSSFFLPYLHILLHAGFGGWPGWCLPFFKIQKLRVNWVRTVLEV